MRSCTHPRATSSGKRSIWGPEVSTDVLAIANMVLEKTGKSKDLIAWVGERPGQVDKHCADAQKIKKVIGLVAGYEFERGPRRNDRMVREQRSFLAPAVVDAQDQDRDCERPRVALMRQSYSSLARPVTGISIFDSLARRRASRSRSFSRSGSREAFPASLPASISVMLPQRPNIPVLEDVDPDNDLNSSTRSKISSADLIVVASVRQAHQLARREARKARHQHASVAAS